MDIVSNNTRKPTRSNYSLLKECTGVKLVSNTEKKYSLKFVCIVVVYLSSGRINRTKPPQNK
jgi:hypothetical protein